MNKPSGRCLRGTHSTYAPVGRTVPGLLPAATMLRLHHRLPPPPPPPLKLPPPPLKLPPPLHEPEEEGGLKASGKPFSRLEKVEPSGPLTDPS